MKVKELLREIQTNPEYQELDELSFIRKIYIEIGKNKTFDVRYYFGNTATQKQIYRLAKKRTGVEDRLDDREIICYSLARQCEYIFKKLGYSCTVTHEPKELEHVFNILTLKNGDRIKLDLQADLEFIQTRRRTRHFGTTDDEYVLLTEVPTEELERVDRNIGYTSETGEYTDEVINSVISNLSDLPLAERVTSFINDEDIIKISADMGYMQQYSFYYKMLTSLAENEIWKKLYIFPCKMSQEEYTSCIFIREQEPTVFLYSNKHNKLLSVDIDKIPDLQEEGLKLGVRGTENGVKLLKRAITERKRKLEDSEQSL